MTKKLLIFSAAVCTAMGVSAQLQNGDPGQLEILCPDGVTANVSSNERDYAEKNMVVSGSDEKGWKVFFCADDGVHGEELWDSDGTQGGSYMVKDIYPGANTSNINWLTRFNDKVIFSAQDETGGQEMWISDGTAEGTHMVADVNELGNSDPRGLCQLNETQFVFFAKDTEAEVYGEWWLYVSDGTEEGTSRVKEVASLFPGREPGGNRNGDVVRVARKVFFIGDVSAVNEDVPTCGDELWVTDGTPEGTYMVMDINKEKDPAIDSDGNPTGKLEGATRGAAIAHLCNFYNEKLFFKAWSWASGNEPWAYDLATGECYEIYNTNPTINPNKEDPDLGFCGNGGNVTRIGYPSFGYMFYRGSTPETGTELAMTNCEKGNFRIFDIDTYAPTESSHSYPDEGCEFSKTYVFCANTGNRQGVEEPVQNGGELNACDGEKTWLVYDFNPGIGSCWVRTPQVIGGTLYYAQTGNRNNHKATLIRLDKIDGEPVEVTNIDPTNDGVTMLRNLNGKCVFYSTLTKTPYCYTYDNPDKDMALNPDRMEIEFEPNNPLHAGIESVIAGGNDANAPVEYFNIQGMRVDANTPGLYIRRQGGTTRKVVIR